MKISNIVAAACHHNVSIAFPASSSPRQEVMGSSIKLCCAAGCLVGVFIGLHEGSAMRIDAFCFGM